jgi:hypothetical protein
VLHTRAQKVDAQTNAAAASLPGELALAGGAARQLLGGAHFILNAALATVRC